MQSNYKKKPHYYVYQLLARAYLMLPWHFYKINQGKKREVEKILIIPQLTRIGDLVCSTPVFRALKETYPRARLSVLVAVQVVGIIKHNPHIDEILIFEDYDGNELVTKIREKKYDVGLSLSGTALSILLLFLGQTPHRLKLTRVNRPLTERLTDWLSTRRFRYEHHTYLLKLYERMVESLGATMELKCEVYAAPGASKKVTMYVRERRITPEALCVGVSLSAGNKLKEWGDDNFIAVLAELIQKYQATIIFIGPPSDKVRIDRAQARLPVGTSYSAVGFSLEDLPELMKRFSLFLSVDTGPTHIADALGVPLVDVVGPIDPEELSPRGQCRTIVKAPGIPPSYFIFKTPGSREHQRRAREETTVKQVVLACEETLEKCSQAKKLMIDPTFNLV